MQPLGVEAADRPSPRTAWSITNRRELVTWDRCHTTLRNDAQAYVPRGTSSQLVLFGDSITESWRGTSYGRTIPRTRGVPDVLSESLAARWPAPLPLGIAADCTQHLLWRMIHGELSAAMKDSPRLVFVLLIGTNNLGRGHTVDETARGVVACAYHLLNATRGQLVVNALLPRGDKRKRGPRALRGRSFMSDIRHVNAALNVSVHTTLRNAFPGRARYVDCGAPFFMPDYRPGDGEEPGAGTDIVDRGLMPDRLHPNAAGHRKWAACLQSSIESAEAASG